MMSYRRIHAAKVRAARRKLRRKQARWRGKTIIRARNRKGIKENHD